ncbi:hypothetical protein [Flavobacterium sp. 3HN19-14]|uniref:hypothetical protein n=1 Tax=Flavobacterium sp. 3HN19-14 TaxID=3448133 RepID=UPI003EE0C96E
MLYCTFARVALSRVYNERINSVSVTSYFGNEPGKNTILHVDVDMGHCNGNLYSSHKTYRGKEWNDNTINERKAYFNVEVPKVWDNMVATSQSDLGDWAMDAISLLEAEFPYTTQEGLAELQTVMNESEYKKFADDYYPNESIYNHPVTSRPKITTKNTRPSF